MGLRDRLKRAANAFAADESGEAASRKRLAKPYEYYLSVYGQNKNYGLERFDTVVAKEGYEIYRKMMHDDAITSSIRLLQFARLSTPFRWHPSSSDPIDVEIADDLTWMFDTMTGFSPFRFFWQTMDALVYGHSCQEPRWEGPVETPRGRLVYKVRTIMPLLVDTLVYKRDKYGDWDKYGVWQLKDGVQTDIGSYAPDNYRKMPRDRFVIWNWLTENGDPYGVSLLRACYRWWKAKREILGFLLSYTERFGRPAVMGRYSGGDQAALDSFRESLENFHTTQVAAFEDGADVDMKELNHTASKLHLEGIQLCNRSIARSCNLPSLVLEGGEKTGSNALGSAQKDTFALPVKNLGLALEDEAARDQLAQMFVRMNYGDNIVPPRGRFDEFQKPDLEVMISAIQSALDLGLTVPENWTMQMLGIPQLYGDKALEKPEPVVPPMGEPEPFNPGQNGASPDQLGLDRDQTDFYKDLIDAKGSRLRMEQVLRGRGPRSGGFISNGQEPR